MNTQTEKMLTTTWNLVRDAGSTVGDAAMHSRVGNSLVRSYPKVKEMVSVGAGLALVRQGTRVALRAVRRHPLATIAGAVALAGVGLAITVHNKRKQARATEDNGGTGNTRRLKATNMRSAPKRASREKSAARTPRSRKGSTDGE